MWLTVKEAAKCLEKSEKTIRRMIKKGDLEIKKEITGHGRGGKSMFVKVDIADSQMDIHSKDGSGQMDTSGEKSKWTPEEIQSQKDTVSGRSGEKSSKGHKNSQMDTSNHNSNGQNQMPSQMDIKISQQSNINSQIDIRKENFSGQMDTSDFNPHVNPQTRESNPTLNQTPESLYIEDVDDEAPEEYQRIGQLRAQIVEIILKIHKKKPKGKSLAYDVVSEIYSSEQVMAGWENIGSLAQEIVNVKHELIKLRPNDTKLSTRTLMRWKKKYKQAGNDFFGLVPRYNRGGGVRSISEEESRIALSLYLSDNQPTWHGVASMMKAKAMLDSNFECKASVATIVRFLKDYEADHKAICILAREGEKSHRDKCLQYIERDWDLLNVGDVWFSDGKVLNFTVIDPIDSRPKRLMLCVFFDARSRSVVGMSLTTTENTAGISDAFRAGIINWGGSPKYAYIDNGKAFKSKYFVGEAINLKTKSELSGLYERLGTMVKFAIPYNAQAKIVERFFRTFDEHFERFVKSYVGRSVAHKPAALKRNEKFMQKINDHKAIEYNEALRYIEGFVVNFYHKMPHGGLKGKTPEEVYNSQPCPEERRISVRKLNYLMLKKKEVKVTRQGVKFLGVFYYSQELYKHLGKIVTIRYDHRDLRHVQVVNELGKQICLASMVEKSHPLIDIDPNKAVSEVQLQKQIKAVHAAKRKAKQDLKLVKELTKQEEEFIPQIEGDLPHFPVNSAEDEAVSIRDLTEAFSEDQDRKSEIPDNFEEDTAVLVDELLSKYNIGG